MSYSMERLVHYVQKTILVEPPSPLAVAEDLAEVLDLAESQDLTEVHNRLTCHFDLDASIQELSDGVNKDTADSYRRSNFFLALHVVLLNLAFSRLMKAFNTFLVKHGFLTEGGDIYCVNPPFNTPSLIVFWIMSS